MTQIPQPVIVITGSEIATTLLILAVFFIFCLVKFFDWRDRRRWDKKNRKCSVCGQPLFLHVPDWDHEFARNK